MALSLLSQLTITFEFKCIILGEDQHNRNFEKVYQKLVQKEGEKSIPLPVPRLKNACSAPEIGR